MDMEPNKEKPYIETEVDGFKYQVYPVTGRAATHLDRKVTRLFALYGIENGKGAISKLISYFGTMDDSDFEALVDETFVNVVRVGDPSKGESNVRVDGKNVYDLFRGNLDGLYGLMLEMWGLYECSPFVMMKKLRPGA